MTDKLHCPWCGTKLVQIQDMDFYYCGNLCCQLAESLKAPASIWRALIDGKKAQDALLFISNIRGVGMSYQDMFLDAQAIAKYASGRTSDLILVGRYTQDELNEIAKSRKGF